MKRLSFILILFATLSTLLSAQSPSVSAPPAAEQLKLFKTNRVCVGCVWGGGLSLTTAGTALDRAMECRKAAVTLGDAIKSEADASDPNSERVAELSEHLTRLVDDGVATTLAEARAVIPPGSSDFKRYLDEEDFVKAELLRIQAELPNDGKLAKSGKVKEARGKLEEAFKKITSLNTKK